MSATSTPARRTGRSLAFAAVTVALASGAHWLGSGMVASPTVLAISCAAAVLLGWFVAGRRRGATVVLAAVGAQLTLHIAFCLSMSGGADAMSWMLCGQHAAAHPPTIPGLVFVRHTPLSTRLLGARGVPMLLAHLAAAAASGAWMHAGDRLVASLATLLAAVLGVGRAFARSPLTVPAPRSRRRAPVSRPSLLLLRGRAVGASGLRGPPPALPC